MCNIYITLLFPISAIRSSKLIRLYICAEMDQLFPSKLLLNWVMHISSKHLCLSGLDTIYCNCCAKPADKLEKSLIHYLVLKAVKN
jgi:hypothetical protein